MKISISQRHYLTIIGCLIFFFANPLLYLFIGVTMIDIKNLFGADIDRQSISFSSTDPFIQAMLFVSYVGLFVAAINVLYLRFIHWSRKNKKTDNPPPTAS